MEDFYAENGLLVPTRATQIQQVFEVLEELFGRFRLRTNMVKTAIM